VPQPIIANPISFFLLLIFDLFSGSFLKISRLSPKTEKKSFEGALKLEVPKMPKMS